MDPGAEAIHGISAADVADCPTFADVRIEVAAMLAGADIGGFALAGDLQILERQLQEVGYRWQVEKLRIVDALRIWQARERRTLSDAYRHFAGGDPEELPQGLVAHDARADVAMAVAVLEAQAAPAPCPDCRGSGIDDRQHIVDKQLDPTCGPCNGTGTADQPSAADLHAEALPDQIDPGGKFRRRADGTIIYGFGAHRLLPVAEHLDYLNWMIDRDFAPSTARIARQLLANGGKLEAEVPEPEECG